MATVLREIIEIDEEKCDGCGDCISSCAEGALEIIDGKARLKADKFCDGAGVCIGHCPQDAITIHKREAEEFDEVAVQQHLNQQKTPDLPQQRRAAFFASGPQPAMGGCPGSRSQQFDVPDDSVPAAASERNSEAPRPSRLGQWPVQLHLVPPNAPYFQNADLLITADCVPFAYADYHKDFLQGKPVVVGCPKLDDLQAYVDKLTLIFQHNNLKSVQVLLMEVPCCGGIAQAAMMARRQAGVDTPITITTIGVRGDNLGSQEV